MGDFELVSLDLTEEVRFPGALLSLTYRERLATDEYR